MSKKELHQTGVVITRPSHQTSEIKSLVNEHQGHPIEFPLLEIQSKSQNETFQHTVLKLEDYDWAIFISSNAVQFGMPAVKHAFHTLPESIKFAAIGPSTQKALKLFDVQDVLIPEENFDSEGLLATSEMNDIQNKKIVIFRGEGGRETLAETLRARGAEVTYAECYVRTFPQTNLDLLKAFSEKIHISAILITSSEACKEFVRLSRQKNMDFLKDILFIVNHPRMVNVLERESFMTFSSDEPSDQSMMKKLLETIDH
ncbi:MAG: uroporphyrinogen-III synthase [Methylophilaceae bacterium]|jgi:uroporphyrinogen-III synthase